jgi:hypothetical protein
LCKVSSIILFKGDRVNYRQGRTLVVPMVGLIRYNLV